MKSAGILALIALFPIVAIGLVLSVGLTGGSASAPIDPPCTLQTATRYGEVCSEIGVPWELVLLTDYFMAAQKKQKDIENVNPLYAAMEFLVLTERVERWGVHHLEYDDDPETDDEGVPVYDWIYDGTNTYAGKAAILSYIELSESQVTPSNIYIKAVEIAENKATESIPATDTEEEVPARQYSITGLSMTSDIGGVLTDLIGMKAETVPQTIELYQSHYLSYLFFGSAYNFIEIDYELPEIVIGDVTRLDLAKVAASLMGHPYLLGGKSASQGAPKNALDCSGYVDWVYFQCFGATVGKGGGTAMQFANTAPITADELRIGDLGFNQDPSDVAAGAYNHVGIYIGEIEGKKVFIHCGGSYFGYTGRESGRVGISFLTGGTNDQNPLGGIFSPPMKSNNFQYLRRPQFQFLDDTEE